MMHWDYRVFLEDGGYTIRTVYYDDLGAISACSQKPIEPFGESLEDFQEELNRIWYAVRSHDKSSHHSHRVLARWVRSKPVGDGEDKGDKGDKGDSFYQPTIRLGGNSLYRLSRGTSGCLSQSSLS